MGTLAACAVPRVRACTRQRASKRWEVAGVLALGVLAGAACSSSSGDADAGAAASGTSSGAGSMLDATTFSGSGAGGSGAPGNGSGAGGGVGASGAIGPDDGATSSSGTASGSPAADDAAPGSVDAAAAPTDGDAVDAGRVLTPGDGASSGCPRVFCEDFERGTLDPAIWTTKVTMSGATPLQPIPVVQMAKAAHGKYALQVHSDPGKGAAYDFIITNKPRLPGHHFGRAYFNATPKPPGAHTEFLYAGTAGFPNLKYLEVASNGPAWQLTFVDLLPGGGESFASGGTVPVSRWACVEWEFNDTPDQASVFVDGKPVADFTRPSINYKGATTGLVGGFTDFGFGYYSWHPNTAPKAFDLYYDDIVLDTNRIGCLP